MIACLLLGVLVIISDRTKAVNLIAGAINFCIAVWTLALFVFINASDIPTAVFYMRFTYTSAAIFAALLTIFSYIFPTGKPPSKLIINTTAIACIAMVLTIMIPANCPLIYKVFIDPVNGNHLFTDKTFYLIYIIYFVTFFFYGMYVIFHKYLKATSKKIKSQSGTFLLGVLFMATPGMLTNLIFPYFDYTYLFWVGPAMASLFVIAVSYGIIRHGMFDIRLAAIRTLTYMLSLSVLVAMYYGLVLFISSFIMHDSSVADQSPLGVGLALTLLFVFQPIKKFFDRLTNKLFYRDYYNSDEFFASLNRLLTSTTNLRGLLERAANEITSTLKSENTVFFIHGLHGHYTIAGTNHNHQITKEEVEKLESLIPKNAANGNFNTIVAAMLDEEDQIYKLMSKHHFELAIPLVRDGIIGYLFLGHHRTSRYTNRDLKVLRTVADELVIAVENALSIQEVRDVNAANVQQRIDSATKELSASNAVLRQMDSEKNEFVSIASHELRTPMTVIGGYVNLLQREQLGEINYQQKAILGKMGINIKSLIKLVNDMLDLSRLEANRLDIKLSEQSFNQLVRTAINKVKPSYEAKTIHISLQEETSKADIKLYTDPEKFERLLVSLLDNAQKFTNPGGKVTISATVDKTIKMATIRVTDTGVGIKPEAISGLFKKFSQVDDYLQRQTGGTGLGLAISKQIVEKLGGTIDVESTVGEGSTFWFMLPMMDITKK